MKIYRLPAVSCNVIFFNSDETIFSSFLSSFSDSSIYTRSYVSLRSWSPPSLSSFLFSSSRPLICNKREEKKRKTKRMMRCKPPKFISSSSHPNLTIPLTNLSIPPLYFYQFLLFIFINSSSHPNFVLKRVERQGLWPRFHAFHLIE